ncbi:galactokinase-like isoform X2 [Toxorhynchites rutilus septentrionalis]|uniref:galactokinase-like isoform X2 n=1 Tax=Toxorhynchites rutilus septentrionalis TaxID=329112 RepID=UPI00247AB539|nr:galactokinase-like isoform X2 [Toxorhynchites rutilus septentrionalis]
MWRNRNKDDDTKMVSKVVSFDEVVKTSIETFRNTFGSDPDVAACAPGRVNLIGEHVDYNDGFVLPMALPMVTVIVGKKNGTPSNCDVLTCFEGTDEDKRAQFDSSSIAKGIPKWLNYIKGVMFHYGQTIPGFNAVVNSNVPVGGGLSSSAALEVATMTFLEQLTGKKIERSSDKALICMKAEHTFANMPCGIMDQLISVCGQRNRALLIDCRNLITQQIPFDAARLAVLICNSGVKHELSTTEYPARRKQCQQALELMGLKSYRDANERSLNALICADEVLLRRARHVITEIKRTAFAAEMLKANNFEQMGKLMTESHKSLRDDFEVSCHELDILVEAALGAPGVLGSRMTGGGFGGCTVTLLRKDSIEDAVKEIDTIYSRKVGGKYRARFFLAEPADGARIINLNNY